MHTHRYTHLSVRLKQSSLAIPRLICIVSLSIFAKVMKTKQCVLRVSECPLMRTETTPGGLPGIGPGCFICPPATIYLAGAVPSSR